ncbi:MAG: energy transducer TonB [Alphaproteobacteria bacterium]|nr:energy transducer TonB [Alphaproteobacteria bacterium]
MKKEDIKVYFFVFKVMVMAWIFVTSLYIVCDRSYNFVASKFNVSKQQQVVTVTDDQFGEKEEREIENQLKKTEATVLNALDKVDEVKSQNYWSKSAAQINNKKKDDKIEIQKIHVEEPIVITPHVKKKKDNSVNILGTKPSNEVQAEPQFVSAKVLQKIRPKYTREAIEDEIEGKVILMVSIDENGIVADVKLIKGLGYGLDELAIEAVKLWRFHPATLDGKKVADQTRITMDFFLEN